MGRGSVLSRTFRESGRRQLCPDLSHMHGAKIGVEVVLTFSNHGSPILGLTWEGWTGGPGPWAHVPEFLCSQQKP